MYNCAMIKFERISNKFGSLIPIEGQRDIPFDIKRVYYIYNVPENVTRGFHSHTRLHQILICLSGSVKIRAKNAWEEKVFELDNPSEGLYIGNMVWREMFEFSKDAVLLVLASEYYSEEDYIRDIETYNKKAEIFFE